MEEEQRILKNAILNLGGARERKKHNTKLEEEHGKGKNTILKRKAREKGKRNANGEEGRWKAKKHNTKCDGERWNVKKHNTKLEETHGNEDKTILN